MIAPPPCSSIGGITAREARSAVKKFSWRAHSNSSSLVPRKPSRRIRTAPTLLTSTSTRPCRSTASATSRPGPSGWARSTSTATTPSRPWRGSTVRGAPATGGAPAGGAAAAGGARSAASSRATASPMPLLAPVTTATLPSSSRSMALDRRAGAGRGRRIEHAVEPAVDRLGDLLPALADHEQVRSALELEVVGLRGRALVLLVLGLGDGRRHRVVLVGPDDQQRRALLVLEVHLGARVQREVGEPGLVEDAAGLGHRVALVGRRGVLLAERVREPVGELVGREGDDAVARRRMRQRGGRRLQRGERQDEDALRGRRAERHARAAEAAIEQQLDDQPAEGVADQHGRLVELADQRLVMVDDLGQAEARELVGVAAQLLDVAVLARPLWHGDREAALAEVVLEVLPAAR